MKMLQRINSLSVGKQELVNFVFSILFAIVVLLLLVFGIDEAGDFKNIFVKGALNFFVSIGGFYVAIFFFISTFLLLLLKAALLDTPKYKWFNYIAQFITGIFYSLGSCISIVSALSPMHGVQFNPGIFVFGIIICIFGYGLFEILQAAIQRTATPKTT